MFRDVQFVIQHTPPWACNQSINVVVVVVIILLLLFLLLLLWQMGNGNVIHVCSIP